MGPRTSSGSLTLPIGVSSIGLTNYMFDASIPRFIRGRSLLHVMLPLLLIWMLHRSAMTAAPCSANDRLCCGVTAVVLGQQPARQCQLGLRIRRTAASDHPSAAVRAARRRSLAARHLWRVTQCNKTPRSLLLNISAPAWGTLIASGIDSAFISGSPMVDACSMRNSHRRRNHS
jgi:hypothetical protein